MSTTLDTAPDTARLTAASALQKLLAELVVLTLDAKQAHWNMTGPGFLPLHALTDEIAADARTWADRVAERAVALGFAVDARPQTVAAVAGQFPTGFITDREAIAELADSLGRVSITGLASLPALEDADAVAHDAAVEIIEGVDKYRWMLRAQAS